MELDANIVKVERKRELANSFPRRILYSINIVKVERKREFAHNIAWSKGLNGRLRLAIITGMPAYPTLFKGGNAG